MAALTQQAVEEKIKTYIDPYLESDLVSGKCIKDIKVDGGKVHVRDLRLWMGYRVDRNPVLPWLVVAAFLSLGALAVHVQQKFTEPSASRGRAVVGRGQEA